MGKKKARKKEKRRMTRLKCQVNLLGRDIGTEKNKSTAVNQKNPGFRIPKHSEAKTEIVVPAKKKKKKSPVSI